MPTIKAENVENCRWLMVNYVDLRLNRIRVLDSTSDLIVDPLRLLQYMLRCVVNTGRETWLQWLATTIMCRCFTWCSHILVLLKDVWAEEQPVVDVEGLHWVTQVLVRTSSLKEEDELCLIKPDVRYVLKGVLNTFA